MIKDHRAQGETLDQDQAQRQTVNNTSLAIIYSTLINAKVNKSNLCIQPPSSGMLNSSEKFCFNQL
jgi:hypothetical protein